jgi:hypothetical protein
MLRSPLSLKEFRVTSNDFALIASSVAWPVVAMTFLILLYKPTVTLLERLAATLTIKTVKLKAFGAEVELTPELAQRALDELLQDIAESTNELAPEESFLFERIVHTDGRSTVLDLLPAFTRESKDHQRLRMLRDRKLIRPLEGGNWQQDKHPVSSRFGRLVYQLKSMPKDAEAHE